MGADPYRERVRIRASGLLVRNNALLLVKIKSPVTGQAIWMPPGGGVEFGERMDECLIREFREETGIEIEAGRLRHVNELIKPPYHAVEFYFEVGETGGTLELGSDPEHSADEQILSDCALIPFDAFEKYEIAPHYVKHRYPDEWQNRNPDITFSPNDP